jgi:hypothetical protein
MGESNEESEEVELWHGSEHNLDRVNKIHACINY